jgi:adenylate cyclase
MFRAHLEQSLLATRRARGASTDYTTLPLAVGFVDLTEFTARSAQLSPTDLLNLVLTFEADACDLVADHGGRVVKLIGDEVMFTAVDAEAACAIALGLLASVGSVDAPNPRGGLAYGPVIAHGGDLYGETVNRAARMADIAIPGEVLVDAAVVSLSGGLQFDQAGRRQLKGFRDPVELWSLTKAHTTVGAT